MSVTSDNLEIERKFLVKQPRRSDLDLREELDIVQTYLTDGKNGSQRRVREITQNGRVSRTYTEKLFITDITRHESEREISAEEYSELLKEAKRELVPIRKKRLRFNYEGQLFELDIYPFSEELATLELELESSGQTIIFPDFIEIIKEVTGVKAYSNSELGRAGRFPEDAPTEGDI